MRIVNIHPSYLPSGRGAWPMAVTILRGLTESGVTIHKMTNELDAGDILLQRKIIVEPDENQETLMEKQRGVLPEMIRERGAEPEGMWNNAAAQDETAAEYWPCPTEEDWTITDGMDEDCVERVLRAFYGYEVIYKTKEEKWELIRALLKDTEEENAVCFPFGHRVICAMKARKLQ
jgi:methionyl-tRNA formyltransferase